MDLMTLAYIIKYIKRTMQSISVSISQIEDIPTIDGVAIDKDTEFAELTEEDINEICL